MNILIRPFSELIDFCVGLTKKPTTNLYLKLFLFAFTAITYGLVASWEASAILMVSIGVHEQGHCWAMKKCGIGTTGFYFIPFFGGLAVSESQYKSQRDASVVAIMGPMWGMLSALLTWIGFLITHNTFLGVAAYIQAVINLFNLIPINPLDGGKIFKAVFSSISKRALQIFEILSICISVGLMVITRSTVCILIIVMSTLSWLNSRKQLREQEGFYDDVVILSRPDMCYALVAWLVLVIELVLIICTSSFSARQILQSLSL